MQSNKMMSVLSAVLRIGALSLSILLLFAVTALCVMGVAAWLKNAPFLSEWNIYLGILCGLIVWLFVAIFHVKKEVFLLPVHDRETFMSQVGLLLQELGYEIQVRTEEHLVGSPSFHALLFGGSIHVQAMGYTAIVVGPKVYLEMLRGRLRIRTHIDNVHKSVLDHRQRQGVRLLKRVQISMRVPKEQWNNIYQEVIEVLEKKGGEVLCEVTILAQSTAGMEENTVETPIRAWLKEQNVHAEIHKEYVTPS